MHRRAPDSHRRRAGVVFFAAAVALVAAGRVARADDGRARSPAVGIVRASPPDVARARDLDREGVRAFRDGHYRDAMRFFAEAFRYGGPSSEIWNIARCHQRLDEPELEHDALERYLAQNDLTGGDRAEATRELAELRRRPSTVSIDSDPRGASVTVDGKRLGDGVTPVSAEVQPGTHRIHVEKSGVGAYDAEVEARYGRAILVNAKLAGRADDPRGPAAARVDPTDRGAGEDRGDRGDRADDAARGRARVGGERGERADDVARDGRKRFAVAVEGGISLSHLGDVDGGVRPSGVLSFRYTIVDRPRFVGTVGARGSLSTVAWSTSTAPPPSGPVIGCVLARDYTFVELGFLVTGGAALRVSKSVLLGGDLGIGVVDLPGASQVGGDVFVPSCSAAPGARPLVHLGTEVSIALGPALRLLLAPVIVEAHAAYAGTRVAPGDASATWWRFGSTAGVAFDF